MAMTIERIRDWHRKVQQEWSNADVQERMRLVAEFPHGSAATFLDAHLTRPALAVDVGGDTRRIDHLERLIQCAYLGACFELDGGIHLTIEAPGSEPVAYRYKNNLREAIDADIASGGDHQA